MSENRKKTQKSKRSQKSTIGNPTPLHFEEEETTFDHEGTANEVEVVDPDIVKDSDVEVNQDFTDGKSNKFLDKYTYRFVKFQHANKGKKKEKDIQSSRCQIIVC